MKTIYIIEVNTGGSLDVFKTHDEDVLCNLRHGNESMIFFTTIEGHKVAVPTRFMVVQKEEGKVGRND